jgi:hypothetical protein
MHCLIYLSIVEKLPPKGVLLVFAALTNCVPLAYWKKIVNALVHYGCVRY